MMAAYADYTYYTQDFGGTRIKQEHFAPLAIKASAIVDRLTFGRAADAADDPELSACVKNAVCAAAESLLVPFSDDDGALIKSENNDGYSLTYADGAASEKLMQDAAISAAALLPTELREQVVE